ncbi:LOW QUALITY PROTEIN: hypothetical protein HID58_010861 [Brassica napus]|uniref:Aldehyde dehydrogenase domain-containing protein n=1 Tax=Brassica napus TaxID=3708 RepID=A0ABQ8DWP2_BRANA|nr:LOW QUALITY PROTEIN: hypothetical protein HID58_010861 [Brassica napus]
MCMYSNTSGTGRVCYSESKIVRRFGTSSSAEEIISLLVQVSYTQLLNNGNFVDAASGKTFPTLDPHTGEVILNVAEGDADDINRAVKAARKAIDERSWPRMIAYVKYFIKFLILKVMKFNVMWTYLCLVFRKSSIMLRFADLVEKHSEEIAALETSDNGNTYEQAKTAHIPMLAGLFRYDAGIPHQNLENTIKISCFSDKIHGLIIPADGNYHVQTLHELICVTDHSMELSFSDVCLESCPALTCGKTIVLKTAEQTPHTAFYVGKLLLEEGLPPGVLNIISGFGPTAGAYLTSHMDLASSRDKSATSSLPCNKLQINGLSVCKSISRTKVSLPATARQ